MLPTVKSNEGCNGSYSNGTPWTMYCDTIPYYIATSSPSNIPLLRLPVEITNNQKYIEILLLINYINVKYTASYIYSVYILLQL